MDTTGRFIVSFFCLLLSAQASAIALNPDYVNKKVYLNIDGTGVLKTLENHMNEFFWVYDIATNTQSEVCSTQKDTETTKPTIYIKTIGLKFCDITSAFKAGAKVGAVFNTHYIGSSTLCLLDPVKPGKADCGKGYEPLPKTSSSLTPLSLKKTRAPIRPTLKKQPMQK